MSEGEGPSAGAILVGIFVVLFGLCITLVGGGCTVMWLYVIFSGSGLGDGALLFLVSLAVFAGGLGILWVGAKMLLGKYRA